MSLKRLLLLLLAACTVFAFSSCGEPEEVSYNCNKQIYSIGVVTEGGMPLENVTVTVYTDSSKTNLENAGITDGNGIFTFEAYESDKYVAVLNASYFADGYIIEKEYPLHSNDNGIVVKTALTDKAVNNANLYLGDIAFDFEITDANGKTYKASEILKAKKAIVLNFWFENCGPCRMEFPYMQESYEEYKDKLEIFALNPLDGTQESVKRYAESLSLTFPVAAVNKDWQTAIRGLVGFPTTVIIDRYGMVVFMHTGAITEKETFNKLFAHFTSDDYVQKPIRNISDIK